MKQRVLLLCLLLMVPGLSAALSVQDHPYIASMVDRLVQKHGLDRDELVRTFQNVELLPEVVKAIKRPAERLPWHRYRSFFVNPPQIENGLAFWRRHEEVLARAEREMGVPQEIIVAVIGIETRYGATLGSHPVLNSLTTLTLRYPRRQKFFGTQLEEFLLLTHEHGMDPLTIRGSYAGAIGIPQFMPNSYRSYAVDFNGDGRTDLLNQTEDAIGSVANYLSRFEWRPGQPVSMGIMDGQQETGLLNSGKRLYTTAGKLRAAGIRIANGVPDSARAGVVSLEGKERQLRWVVFENFYVLTRYNPNVQYAMAVHELSTALRRNYGES